jgi:lysozyme family protein
LFTWNFEPCQQKAHYEDVMKKKVLAVIENAESEYADLQHLRQVFFWLMGISLCIWSLWAGWFSQH